MISILPTVKRCVLFVNFFQRREKKLTNKTLNNNNIGDNIYFLYRINQLIGHFTVGRLLVK